MSDSNSIWPNGMGVDENGYAVFYPMGTNKVEIPKNSPHWPKGNKLIGQFVYKDGKLVGFCDTKAMTATSGDIIVMPYEHIDIEFDSIEKDSIQIHAPKATYKKASWSDSDGKIDIPDVEYKYKGCKNVNGIKDVDANYLENDIVDGKWTELLSDLDNSAIMFFENENITSFTSDLSSLTGGASMFKTCSNLVIFSSDLKSLTHGGSMFINCSNLVTFECSDLSSLTNGNDMFSGCSNLKCFNSDLSSLTSALRMFFNCSNLIEFNCSNLDSLTNGGAMFAGCHGFSSFGYDLSSLINGNYMFQSCSNLTTINTDLSSLETAVYMFADCVSLVELNFNNLKSLTDGNMMFYGCKNIKSFNYDLSSLITAQTMFQGCINFTSFNSNLSSLTNGNNMFAYCNELISFKSDLSSLTSGSLMFANCKLDISSVKNIIDTINIVSSETESPSLYIGMGCNNNNEDKNLFAQEVGYPEMTTLLQALQNKGWTVNAQFTGRPSSNYSLRQPESLPVYVKLIEVIPTDADSFYEYTSADETKFYNLDWFHETTGSTDTYTQFNSLEEAITTFNIKPIEK